MSASVHIILVLFLLAPLTTAAPVSASSYLLDKLLDAIVNRILSGRPVEVEANENAVIFRQSGNCQTEPYATPSSRIPQIIEPSEQPTAPPPTTSSTGSPTSGATGITETTGTQSPGIAETTSRNPFWWWVTDEPSAPWWWNRETSTSTPATSTPTTTKGWFWWSKAPA